MDLTQLDKPVQFLRGVGPRRAESLQRMGLLTARDLLRHVPRRYDDASTVHPIGRLRVGDDATVIGRVRTKGVIPTRARLRIFQAILEDDSGRITAAWPGQPWLDQKFREGDTLLVTGPVKFFHGPQIQPREFVVLDREGGKGGEEKASPRPRTASADGIIFVSYPASEDVPQWVLRGVFEKNLDELIEQSAAEEYLPASERERIGVLSLPEAFSALHRPSSLLAAEKGRQRLAFDELFFLQLLQALVRHRETTERPGIRFERTNHLIRPLHAALPFELTGAQARALREITADMTSPRRMNRMLQGDVGAGKTLVALFAMLLAAEDGRQAAMMAPTEILAEQHARRLRELVEPLGVRVALLTGRLKSAERREVTREIADGSAPLVVGTHALIQEGVEFANLGLAVVDEQHRFGVRQRMALTQREPAPDLLLMSATPIPRSLAMTLYGDLDLSVLDELPPGRQPVRTYLRGPAGREEVHEFVRGELEAGRQGYVVYPLVDESDKVDLKAATVEHQRLADEVFPERSVGLLHGQMSGEAKDAVMRDFLAGGIDLLVATTVIEVGIDVPNATVMVIEHAERFGLSQLHQLRGRVGRGAEASHCILIADAGEVSGERLKIFRDTTDGFEIARADLRIRGQGDLFGAQQSGHDPNLRFADLTRDEGILMEAQRMARAVIEDDPRLAKSGWSAVRTLLHARHADRLAYWEVG